MSVEFTGRNVSERVTEILRADGAVSMGRGEKTKAIRATALSPREIGGCRYDSAIHLAFAAE